MFALILLLIVGFLAVVFLAMSGDQGASEGTAIASTKTTTTIYVPTTVGVIPVSTSPVKVTTTTSTTVTTSTILSESIASYSFDDVGSVLCDKDSTDLAKETAFDRYKGNYVQWTGTVVMVDKSLGRYYVGVRHCPKTFTSDIQVFMREDQVDKLLSLKEGDIVTYKAKLSSYSSLLTSTAEDGIIISTEEGESIAGVVTCEEYGQIKTGMTYQQVVAIVGAEADLSSESEFMGIVSTSYSWSNPDMGGMTLIFQNDRLTSKTQLNLC